MIEDIFFYLPQLLMGMAVGLATSILGVFVTLRKTIFLGITLSQAITVSVIISFLLDLHYEAFVHILSIIIFLPLYWLHTKVQFKESLLAGGFVFYTATGQILSSIGANIQNHIIVAYFGNILFISSDEWMHIIFPLLSVVVLLLVFYKKIIAVSYDKDYAKIIKLPVFLTEIIYFIILSAVLTISIYFMGSFYTIAHMVIPALVGLQFARSMYSCFILSGIISILSTFSGFIISLIKIEIQGVSLQLPTSSTIVLVMAFFMILLFFKKDG